MATSFPLKVGAEIEISMRMPMKLAGAGAGEIHCTARVVHVGADKLLDECIRAGLHIERYEPLSRGERCAN
jgi:hypothetical protein